MTDIDDVEEQVFRERLAGKSLRVIAKQFNRDVAEVSEIVTRMCAPLSPELKRQALSLDLERLDALMAVFYAKAQAGDQGAAMVVLRCQERRASLLGLDIPASARSDAVVQIAMAPVESTTDRIERALARLAAERPALPAPSNGHGEEPEPDQAPSQSMQKS